MVKTQFLLHDPGSNGARVYNARSMLLKVCQGEHVEIHVQ